MLVEIEAIEPGIAGLDRAEPTYIVGVIEADVFFADAGAESVIRFLHRIVVCALSKNGRSY